MGQKQWSLPSLHLRDFKKLKIRVPSLPEQAANIKIVNPFIVKEQQAKNRFKQAAPSINFDDPAVLTSIPPVVVEEKKDKKLVPEIEVEPAPVVEEEPVTVETPAVAEKPKKEKSLQRKISLQE